MSWKDGIIESAEAVTPNDSTDLPGGPAKAWQVTVAGTVKLTYVGGAEVTLQAVAGVRYYDHIARIHSTGTTATGITAHRL